MFFKKKHQAFHFTKKTPRHRGFPENFAKFFITTFDFGKPSPWKFLWSVNFPKIDPPQKFTGCCLSVPKKCPYWEFFWSVFSHIRTEYGDLQSKKHRIRTLFTECLNYRTSLQSAFTCSKLTCLKVCNMFKFNNKDTRTTSFAFWCLCC